MNAPINMSITTAPISVSRPRITLLMILCGVVGAATAGTVSAATTQDAVPAITVKYDPQSLATDAGVKAVYRRLVKAAEVVCPNVNSIGLIMSNATLECRRQAVDRAVHQIDNPRLAAMVAPRVKAG